MSLDVYLYSSLVGTLFPAGDGDYRFAYRPAAVEQAGAGARLLSVALPARVEPFSNESSRSYIEGLLPEGPLRRRLAREIGVDPDDGYALLAALGRDAPGAAVFLPKGEALPAAREEVEWLTTEELAAVISSPRGGRLSAAVESGACLGGSSHKVALTRKAPRGPWALPSEGLPSTHVLKPETGEFPGLVANEAFCMTVARRIGLPVSHCSVARLGADPCLVVKRFDRRGEGLEAERLHQEDFCQALGFARAGERDGWATVDESPGFAECCGLLRALDRLVDVPVLIAAAFCNYLLGNGDAHASNFALLHGQDGSRLAPLYDISSTAVYDHPAHSGLVLNEEYDETVFLLELARVSEECDFSFDVFRQVAAATAANLDNCIEDVADRAREEGWHAPVIDDIVELARERAFGLVAEVHY